MLNYLLESDVLPVYKTFPDAKSITFTVLS